LIGTVVAYREVAIVPTDDPNLLSRDREDARDAVLIVAIRSDIHEPGSGLGLDGLAG
jgi:hypothetical protein